MNLQVSYDDPDSGDRLTKICLDFHYESGDSKLEFMPVDDPVKIYKTHVIYHPIIKIDYRRDSLRLDIDGFCYIKGEYIKSLVIIENK